MENAKSIMRGGGGVWKLLLLIGSVLLLGGSTDVAKAATIWPGNAVPTLVDGGADDPVELGVKFRSDVAGRITGIRFYKAVGNTGTHVGSLWSSSGTRLAFATFAESASGWQQVNLSTPVSITANTVYIASYHCPAGHYSADANYFATSGVDNPPLHALANGGSGGNSVYAYGPAGSFPNQTWQSANYWVDVVFEATPTAPLNAITVSPSNPSVPSGGTQQFAATGTYSDGTTRDLTDQVTWTSSNSQVVTIDSDGLASAISAGTSTIRATSGTVSGTTTLTVQASPLRIDTTGLAGGTVNTAYTATLAASGGTPPRTWSLANGSLPPGLVLGASNGAINGTPTTAGTFNFTVRVTDSSNPAQTASKALSITVATASSLANLWSGTTVPGIVDGGADSPVELGVKFRSDVAGTITGIRFYKAAANSGPHIASLWSSTGARLAFATIQNETASGWQHVIFSSPVPINANTTYIASYHCPSGHYSINLNYFATTGVDRPPLHALSNGTSGGNGVFRYGPAGSFPNQTWQSANYWVDVSFQQGTGADTFSPTVTSVSPQPNLGGVSLDSAVTATFSEPINPSTLNTGTVLLREAGGTQVSGTVTYNSNERKVTLVPNTPLTVSSTYTATIKGGSSGVADVAGNRLNGDLTWSFTTATYGALAGGPGGPILIVSDTANPFSKYYAEILLAEGLNCFDLKDISDVNSTVLAAADVVILAATSLTNGQVTMFSDWVTAGGNLIAMRPDKKLAGLLGLTDAGTTLSEGYLLIDTASGPGVGIVGETIQYHGIADRYNLGSAQRVARLYTNAQTATSNPAVTLRNVGANGGQAAAFVFDLARSIVLMRQGNPAWAGQDRDGSAPLRSNDLFFGASRTDPQRDWIDFDKVAIPQADEQQRLLANLITIMCADRKLLPRFWYLPHGHQAALVMTGDDHANNGTKGRFDNEDALSPVDGSLNDWETIRSTSYIFVNNGALTDAEAVAYTAAGFELGLHLDTGCSNYTKQSLETLFNQQLSQWRARYPSLGTPVTLRTHCIAWSGYTITPEVEAEIGIRLDTNYYYWPADWILNRPGFMTGSAMPMRFATAEGNVLDVYQAATQMTDESGQRYPFTPIRLFDKALGPEGYYGAFVANMHTDRATFPDYDALVLAATDRNIPIISARQLLTWTDARNSSEFGELQSSNDGMEFALRAAPDAKGLKVMVPIPTGAEISNASLNGGPITYTLRVVKGIQYAFVDARTGRYQITFRSDLSAPQVTMAMTPGGTAGFASNIQVEVQFSEPLNPKTINADTFILHSVDNTEVPVSIQYSSGTNVAAIVPRSTLASGCVYTLVVKGGKGGVTDIAGNPLAVDFRSTFSTVPTIPRHTLTNSNSGFARPRPVVRGRTGIPWRGKNNRGVARQFRLRRMQPA